MKDFDAASIPPGISSEWYGKKLTHCWAYKSQDNEIIGYTARYDKEGEKKKIVPYFNNEDGIWKYGGPSAPKPLFGLDLIKGISRDSTIYVAEGEKCATALKALDLPAFTNVGGTNSVKSADWSPLQLFKKVVILQDNDEPGKKYVKDVASQLAELPGVREIDRVLLERLPEKGDVVDWIIERKPTWNGYGAIPREAGDELCTELLDEIESVTEHVDTVNIRAESPSNEPGSPAPLAEDALHGIVGEVVRVIEPHTEADPVALLVNLLTAFGNAAGLNSYFVAEADKHYPRLFCTLVGETSKGRKGTSWGYIRNLFETVEPPWKDCQVSGLSSGEGLIWTVRDEITKKTPIKDKKRIVDYQDAILDEGVKDKRLFVLEAELASTLRVIGRDGNTLSPVMRAAWDTGDLRSLTKNSPAKATGAHISILGHITRQELLRYLNRTEAGNGFANRFLWFCVKRSKCLPEGGNISEINFTPMVEQLKTALEFAQEARKIERSNEAKELWASVYPKLSDGLPGMLGAVTGRAEAQVMRIAMIYALMDCSIEIEVEHLRAALSVWAYSFASARYIFGDALGDPLADEILVALQSTPDGMTRTDISNLFERNKNRGQIKRALNNLKNAGKIRSISESTGGAPAERYLLCA